MSLDTFPPRAFNSSAQNNMYENYLPTGPHQSPLYSIWLLQKLHKARTLQEGEQSLRIFKLVEQICKC